MNLTLVENKVLPIYKDSNDDMLVDARELHLFLESKQEFSSWIKKRIAECELTENQDYISLDKNIKAQGAGFNRVDYALTLDSAKHLAMMERNTKGKEIRQYFINFEKETRKALSSRDFQKEKIIEAFIQELGPYAPMFPRRFYDGLYTLLGWEQTREHNKHPGYMGTLTRQLCHSKIAPGVLEELERRNPYSKSTGHRQYKHTQLLTNEIGKNALKEQIDFVCRMMPCVDTIQALLDIVERDYQNKFGGTKQLSFLKVRYEMVAQ